MENFNANQHITFTSSKPIYDFYVAGPYQTAEQVESMERLERVLQHRNLSVYRPRFAMDVNVSGPEAVFENRIEAIKNGTEVVGNRTRAKIVKNKVAPPFREAEFEIMYGEGISKLGELVDLAVKLDIVQKSGSWFSMGDTRVGQGRDAVKKYFEENPEIAEKVEAEVRANSYKLMSRQSQVAAKAAGRAVDVSADDFEG